VSWQRLPLALVAPHLIATLQSSGEHEGSRLFDTKEDADAEVSLVNMVANAPVAFVQPPLSASAGNAQVDWADTKAVEIFAESGSDMGYAAKEQFLMWLAEQLRDLVKPQADLLAALERLLDAQGTAGYADAVGVARTAIAKARGAPI
jgi:hypothetical protein